jgi:lipopolysaccharide export LptBFGC system permease protein LptF
LPFVIALFTAPFALSLNRTGKAVTVGYAVGLWLLYTGVTNLFEQFGLSGFLSPTFAVYSPILIFSMLGVYLLTRVRT